MSLPLKAPDFYRADGRLYEIEVENNILHLRLKKSVVLERRLFAVLFGFLALIFDLAWLYLAWNFWSREPNIGFVIGLSQVPFQFVGQVGFLLLSREDFWSFEKKDGGLLYRWNGTALVTQSEVRVVKASRRGEKFYLCLIFRRDKSFRIGRFGFALKERVWREDAARIADFLDVPLEISIA